MIRFLALIAFALSYTWACAHLIYTLGGFTP